MPKAKLIIGKDRLLIYEGIIFWLWKRKKLNCHSDIHDYSFSEGLSQLNAII